MIAKDSKNRPCEVEIEHASSPCDSFATRGVYLDTPDEVYEELDESELNWIDREYAGAIQGSHHEYLCGIAESSCEGDR